MAATRNSRIVPHEFVGQARLFCTRIDDAAKTARVAAMQIAADAHAIVRRRPTWRPEHLSGFERQWRQTIPDEGRIGLEIERSKHTLTIAEFRLARGSYEDIRWSQPIAENAVVLTLHIFRFLTPAALDHKRVAIAILSIHTIARRYQRGFDNSDHALKTDIAELALNAERLLDVDAQTFAIRCPSGVWVGATEAISLSNGAEQRVLNVRSFL
jgi:hypothetical protein